MAMRLSMLFRMFVMLLLTSSRVLRLLLARRPTQALEIDMADIFMANRDPFTIVLAADNFAATQLRELGQASKQSMLATREPLVGPKATHIISVASCL